MDGTLLRRRIAAVDVDDVRDRVEREERDADRQQHARHDDRPHAQQQEERVDVVGEEVGVLEDAEEDEVRRDGEGEPSPRGGPRRRRRPASAVDRDRHEVVEDDRSENQPRERPAALGVEDDAEDQQEPVAIRRMHASKRAEVERQQNRKEQEKERRLGEQHITVGRSKCAGEEAIRRPSPA